MQGVRAKLVLTAIAISLCLVVFSALVATAMVISNHGKMMDSGNVSFATEAEQHAGRVSSTPSSTPPKAQEKRLPPTPTTYYPLPPEPTSNDVQHEIALTFGEDATAALAVAGCESQFNPHYQDGYTGNTGVFGISPDQWKHTPYAHKNPFDAWWNIQAGYWLFIHGKHKWNAFNACQPNTAMTK